MYIITYSLRENQNQSDLYYHEAAVFTDEVLTQAKALTASMVGTYMAHIRTKGYETLRTHEEYTLELLILGILWKVYSGDALGLEKVPGQVLAGLAKVRKHGGSLKPGVDFLRGILSTLFLSPDLYDNMFSLEPTRENFKKLLDWLGATGEFNEEVNRLKGWQAFLVEQPQQEACDVLATAITFGVWFEAASEEVLGRYTPNVERFLNEIRPDHYWSEDVIFCGRRRVEYHLNMVGAEIMNRAFGDAFASTTRKAVLVPACMRRLPASKCRAKEAGSGLLCAGCVSECSICTLTVMGKKYGFDVVIVPHNSSLYSGDEGRLTNGSVGVVGVACALNLISGGLMLRGLNVPAQCVLLDYCGCRNHWHNEGLPTEINIGRLKQIMGIRNS